MRTLKQKGKDIVWVVAGNAVLALAVSMFILPYDILSGGVAGIAVALQPLIPLPVTLMVNLLVVGLFILGACFLGKEFAMKTILSSLIYPVFLTFFSGRVPVLDLDPILASLYGGLLGGMGVGMALRTGASTGGMDIPPLIVHRNRQAGADHRCADRAAGGVYLWLGSGADRFCFRVGVLGRDRQGADVRWSAGQGDSDYFRSIRTDH